jgi:hypothetical protein
MPPISPTSIQCLVQTAQVAASAPRGTKGDVMDQACKELGKSRATVYRQLKKTSVRPERRQRSDAGTTSLSQQEAELISALLMESHRKNAKRLLSIGRAVRLLRTSGQVRAETIDAVTGEIVALSDSAIARGLRVLGLHPDQLLQASPAIELRSLYPNHVWQIDASLCVLYYLNAAGKKDAGLQVMPREQFYKNKPANLKRIEADRVWRYVVTDHNSGSIFLHYVLGAESGVNLAESFIAATQQRDDDPFHGVPEILMMDMGSANTSGLFTNLARRLDVQTMAHAPGNARATGQVEKAQDIVERYFESALKLVAAVSSLDELNDNARCWSRFFNATEIHSRHGRTRTEQWLQIQEQQLRIAPPVELCRELLTHEPELRVVSDFLTLSFKGHEVDVSSVPNVMVGEKLMVTYNPYNANAACIVGVGADGNELLQTVPLVVRGDDGFRSDGAAAVIGEEFKSLPDTLADTNRKLVKRIAMDASTDEEALAKRQAKTVPFGGRIKPFKEMRETVLPTTLPKRGTDMVPTTVTSATVLPVPTLNAFQVSARLAEAGVVMDRDKSAKVKQWCGKDGLPEDQLDALQARLTVRTGLRVVAGGGV